MPFCCSEVANASASAVKAGDWPFHDRKTRSAEFDAHVKVKPKRCANIHVVFDFKVHRFRSAPAASDHVAMFVGATRNAAVRQVGNDGQHGE